MQAQKTILILARCIRVTREKVTIFHFKGQLCGRRISEVRYRQRENSLNGPVEGIVFVKNQDYMIWAKTLDIDIDGNLEIDVIKQKSINAIE